MLIDDQKIYSVGGGYFKITSRNNLHGEKEILHSVYLQKKHLQANGGLKDPIRFLKEIGFTVEPVNRVYVFENPQMAVVSLDDE